MGKLAKKKYFYRGRKENFFCLCVCVCVCVREREREGEGGRKEEGKILKVGLE